MEGSKMPKGRTIIYTYWCDRCSTDDEAMPGDRIPDTDVSVRDQATADRAIRSQGWMIRTNGEVLCPQCAGREGEGDYDDLY